MNNIQAVFLDRDGTIGGTGHFLHPRLFTLYPQAAEAIQSLKAAGIKLFSYTNQHLIAYGITTFEEFAVQLREYGFDDVYICPHLRDEGCECRKPKPGMLLQAARDHGLDLKRCVVVGDIGPADMGGAAAVGARKVLVLTGQGTKYWTEKRDMWATIAPDFVAAHIGEATRWILEQNALAIRGVG